MAYNQVIAARPGLVSVREIFLAGFSTKLIDKIKIAAAQTKRDDASTRQIALKM